MGYFKKYVDSSVVLIIFAVLAMICANLPSVKDWYFGLWQNPVCLSVGGFNFFSHNGHTMTLGQVINDFLMAIFFLLVGLEIKREFLVGELSSRDKALLPIIGALGGMIVPVLIFWLITSGDDLMEKGLAIPMATDIAFSLGVLAMFKTRVPAGLKIFLAALAVADDLGGILIIAFFYTTHLNITFIILSAICVAVMLIASRLNYSSKAFYVISGLVLWYLMSNSGVHSTIAGVITAFCVPATLRKSTAVYLERIRKSIRKFPVINVDDGGKTVVLTNDQVHTLKNIESAADNMISPLQDMEDHLHFHINYVVIPLFAFANSGIDLSEMSIATLFTGVGLAAMLGLVLGKFIGVFSFSWLAVRLNIVRLPENTTWKAFASVCVICGIGFTVSMFIADLSYAGAGAEGAELLAQSKLGVLVGSFVSALIGAFLLDKSLPKSH